MKKLYTLIFAAAMACGVMAQEDKPQIPNGDFESWTKYSSNDNAPDHWNSFQTAEGSYAGMAKAKQIDKSSNVRPGSTGQTSCVIWCRAIIGIPAQGNMTTGCINAGAMSAANVANYNFDKVTDETKSMKFTGRPDSIVFWTRFVPKKVIADAPTAKFSAIIHDNYQYIAYGLDSNDTEVNKSHVVAKAVHQIEAKDGAWQRISVPFEYTGNELNAEYIMLNFSTNAIPGKGTAGDSLYVDDIEVIYNEPVPEYKDFTEDLFVVVNGLVNGPQSTTFQVAQPEDNKINFSLKNFVLADEESPMAVGNIEVNDITVTDGKFQYEGNIQITEGDLEGVEMWMGPMLGDVPVALTGEYIAEDFLKVHIAITMEELGQDIEVFLGYTQEEIDHIVPKNFTEDLFVMVNGLVNGPQSTTFQVLQPEDNKINFSLKNFVLADEESPMAVGNIEVNDITVTDGKFQYEGNIQITEGDLEGVEMWVGPTLGDVPVALTGEYVTEDFLKVHIAITMEELGQDIEVYLGYTQEEIDYILTIEDIKINGKSVKAGEMFNVAGQRVADPAKGSIVIKNGKKLIIK